MNSPLFDMFSNILREQADTINAERVALADRQQEHREATNEQQAEMNAAMAGQPDDWQPPLTETEVNRYAAVVAEEASEGHIRRPRINPHD